MSPVVPNLFVIGAPKCATTSLFYWLAQHPDVCGSSNKETYYLLDPEYPMVREGNANFHRDGLEGYSSFFQDCHAEQYRLEATPDYLYQETALEVISQLEPKPQVIVVLRKPSERVYSLYQFARNNAGTLDLDVSFAEFVDAIQNDRELLASKPILRRAIKQSQYVDYLHGWVSALGRENVHVILFENMTQKPLECLRTLCSKLDIDASFYDGFDFVAYNKTVSVKNKTLHRFRARAHTVISRYFAGFIPGRVKEMVHSIYNAINQSPEKNSRTAEEQRVIEEIESKHFAPYNHQLEQLLAIDLAVWER